MVTFKSLYFFILFEPLHGQDHQAEVVEQIE
jgi:hypothetical protein